MSQASWVTSSGFGLLQGSLGLASFFLAAYVLSEARHNVRWKPVGLALVTQLMLAVVISHIGWVRAAFLWVSDGIEQLKAATLVGTGFVFGYVGGGEVPFEVTRPQNTFVFALQALPVVMVVSSLSMLLFHWRILPALVGAFSLLFRRTLSIGGALGVCAAAKVFLGHTEAPLLIRPYLKDLSRSELFSVMALGMATTSASVMVLYASLLEGVVPHPVSHILTASIISVPAAIALGRVMVPQEGADTDGKLGVPYKFNGAMEAVSVGATDGMKLFLNVIAMLIVMLALVALINAALGVLPPVFGEPVSLQSMLGTLLAPVGFLMGLPWHESQIAGRLLGIKIALNEVMAFLEMGKLGAEALGPTGRIVMVYTLCGFANLSSIGIQIGGIGTMAPERRNEIIALGPRALFCGAMASCMSGTVMGMLSRLASLP